MDEIGFPETLAPINGIEDDVDQIPVQVIQNIPIVRIVRLVGFNDLPSSFILGVTSYLTFNDMKSTRRVSKIWNRVILHDQPRFRNQSAGAITTNWYRDAVGMNNKRTIQWTKFAFRHFSFRRNSQMFKTYWPDASVYVTKMELDRCSFECDGFNFILDFCPRLTSLKMRQVKLRDLEDYHGEGARQIQPVTNLPVPQPSTNLIDLSFESMYQVGECFMRYFVNRTGNLESISLVDCFNQEVPPGPNEPTIADMFEDFVDDLVDLFKANRVTLKTMTFKTNCNQNVLLNRLAQEGRATPEAFPFPQNLMISFSTNSSGAEDFYAYYCKDLRSLKLDVMDNVQNPSVIQVLGLVNANLEKLRVSVLGGITSLADLDLRGVLPRFVALEKFNLQDRKPITSMEKRVISIRHRLFPYRIHRGLGAMAARLQDTLYKLNSRVDIRFLAELPPTVTKLTLDGIINYQQFFNNPQYRPGFRNKFSRLTKLEIKGPWICPLGELIKVLIREAKGLETLIMTKCSLTDMDVSGLCKEASADMRKAVTFALGMYTNGDWPSGEVFNQLVENAPQEWDRKRNMRRKGFGAGQRAKISDLKNLKHLDLSYNVNITDVTIFDAMNLPKLKSFAIHSCNKVTDIGMELLAMNCPNLEVLNVKNCRKLSMYGLDQVIRGCKNLRTIYSTRIIRNLNIEGFLYTPSENYRDIVKTCIMTEFEDPNLEDADED